MAAGVLKTMLEAERPLVPVTGRDCLLKLHDANKEAQPDLGVSLVSQPSWEDVVAGESTVRG